MQLTGEQIIGSELVSSDAETFRAFNPATGEFLNPVFHEGRIQDVDRAVRLAEEDFDACRITGNHERSAFLEVVAEQLTTFGPPLIERAHLETGLPITRLEGELGRTTGQIRMFARLVAEGSWVEARIDRALPDRQPVPKPDIRSKNIPLGPVAVFGASNFPLAFSVAGGDTISALAAGCPVVAKGHPAHPGTSEIAARAIRAAVEACGMPQGTFSLVQGRGVDVGAALVRHPLVKAVAFTGSLQGGRALFDLASARPEPIPVFAEMGSINPVFLLPEILAARSGEIAQHFADALMLGVGQFCTNPGLVIAIKGTGLDDFITGAEQSLAAREAGVMLTSGIKQNYLGRITSLSPIQGVEQLTSAEAYDAGGCLVRPALMKVDAGVWLACGTLAEEVFGPASIVVECESEEQLLAVAGSLKGQLTATIHAADGEIEKRSGLVRILERKAGRIIFNGFPTGVEVCDAMVHGGPYPATTDSRSSSVGTLALRRFLRPVCYQNFPARILPDDLKEGNELGLWRLIDGIMSKDRG